MDRQVGSFREIEQILEKLNNTLPKHGPLECIKNIKLTHDESIKIPNLIKYLRESREILEATNERKGMITNYEHITEVRGIASFYNDTSTSISNILNLYRHNQRITNKECISDSFWEKSALVVTEALNKYEEFLREGSTGEIKGMSYPNEKEYLNEEQKCTFEKMQMSLIKGDIENFTNQFDEKEYFGSLIEKFVPEFVSFNLIKQDMMNLLKKNPLQKLKLATKTTSNSCLEMMVEIKKNIIDCEQKHLDENDQRKIMEVQSLIMKGNLKQEHFLKREKERILSILKPLLYDYGFIQKIWDRLNKIVGDENKLHMNNDSNMGKETFGLYENYMNLIEDYEKDLIKSKESIFSFLTKKKKNKVKNDHNQYHSKDKANLQELERQYFDELISKNSSPNTPIKEFSNYSGKLNNIEEEIIKSMSGFSIKEFESKYQITSKPTLVENLIFVILDRIKKDLKISNPTIFEFLEQKDQYLTKLHAQVLELNELLITEANKIGQTIDSKQHKPNEEDPTQNSNNEFMIDPIIETVAKVRKGIEFRNKKISELEKKLKIVENFNNTNETKKEEMNAVNTQLQHVIDTNNSLLSNLTQKLHFSEQNFHLANQELAKKDIQHQSQAESNQKYLRQISEELEWANAEITNENLTLDAPKTSIEEIKNKINGELENLKKNVFKSLNKDKLKFGEEYATKVQKCVDDYLGKDQVIKYSLLFSTTNGGDINPLILGIPNTLTIIKTEHGNLIGCFSSLSHCGKFDGEKTKGFIMSSTLDKYFGLKEGQKPLKADEEKIVFGNDEIVINKNECLKNCEVIMKGEGSVFEVGETKNNEFSMVCSKDVEITGIEIYEVILKNFHKVNVVSVLKEEGGKEVCDKKKKKSKSKDKSLEKVKKEDNERYKKIITKLKEENQQLEKKYNDIQDKINKSDKISESKSSEKVEEQSKRNTNEERISELETKLAEIMHNEKETQKQIREKNEEIQNISLQYKTLTELFEKNEKEKEQLKETIKMVETEPCLTVRESEQNELKIQIGKLEEEIERMKRWNKEMKKQMDENEEARKKTEEIEKMTLLIDGFKKEIELATQTVADLKQQEQEYQEKQSSRSEVEKDIAKLKQEQINLKGQISILENKKQIAERSDKNQQKEEEKYQELLKKVDLLESESKRLEGENEEAAKLIDEQKNNATAIVEDIEKNKRTITQLEEKIEQLQSEEAKLQQSLNSLSDESITLTHQQAKVKAEIDKTHKELTEINKDYEEKRNFLQAYEQKSRKYKEINEELESSEKNWAKFESKRDQLDEEIKCKQQKLEEVSANLRELIKKECQQSGTLNKFFVGSVIDYDEDKKFIVNELEKHYPLKNILKTKLLFSYPLMHGLDPHEFVDNKDQYILLIKMSVKHEKSGKNFVIACYSEMPLVPKGPRNDGVGFISSVTNETTFYLTKNNLYNPHWTEYDQFHLIYGNSEIRFKINQKKIETNIGHNFRSLETGILKCPEILTGEKAEFSFMESYEIFQIIFE